MAQWPWQTWRALTIEVLATDLTYFAVRDRGGLFSFLLYITTKATSLE
jgi:hypothetical protein